MTHDSSILTSSPSRPCDRAFRPVAQHRCFLSPSFRLPARFLPEFPSENTLLSPSRDQASRSSNHTHRASHPQAQGSTLYPNL